MNVQADVSLYPLRRLKLSTPIERFVQRLRNAGLDVRPGAMSTLVAGEAGDVFDILGQAFQELGQEGEVVLVLKISNACPSADTKEKHNGNNK